MTGITLLLDLNTLQTLNRTWPPARGSSLVLPSSSISPNSSMALSGSPRAPSDPPLITYLPQRGFDFTPPSAIRAAKQQAGVCRPRHGRGDRKRGARLIIATSLYASPLATCQPRTPSDKTPRFAPNRPGFLLWLRRLEQTDFFDGMKIFRRLQSEINAQ